MAEKIFISYARKDGESHAIKLKADLKAAGYDVWFDQDKEGGIKPGLAWQKAIEEGIDNCDVFLLVMTPASIQSNNCFAEWSRAINHKKTLLPLKMQPSDGSDPVADDTLPLYIENLQYVDFVIDFPAGWDRLTYRLQNLSAEAEDQEKARKAHGIVTAYAKAYLVNDSNIVPRLPDTLIGRNMLKASVKERLKNHELVLLQGMGGIGKSSLCAEITADALEDGAKAVLWLEVGNASLDLIFAQIGQALGQAQAMAQARKDDDKIKLIRDIMKANNIKHMVIDDAWNPAALNSLLGILPRRNNDISLLMTARQRHLLERTPFIQPVDQLLPEDAKTLLTHHMRSNSHHAGADELCKAVGYHPYMLEIAGKLLYQRENESPAELLARMNKTELVNLSLPEGATEAGRENMAKLLQQSLDVLPDDLTRQVFFAFGAFPNPTATPEMLALYLNENLDEINQRYYLAHFSNRSYPKIDLDNLKSIETALNILHSAGLASRIPAENQGDYPYSVSYYYIHDIAHVYAAIRKPDMAKMVSACIAYTWRHTQPTHENFAALRPELENFMGASSEAIAQKRWLDVERFAWNLYHNREFTFLYYQGYYTQAQILLAQAAEVAGERGDKRSQATHLGNLGIAYRELGDYVEAIEYFQQQLLIFTEIGGEEGRGIALGNLQYVRQLCDEIMKLRSSDTAKLSQSSPDTRN